MRQSLRWGSQLYVLQIASENNWLTVGADGCLWLSGSAWAEPAYALWGSPKYPADFAHFATTCMPRPPRAGQLRLVSNSRASTFDKYNPFTIKGSAPAYLSQLLFDSLLAGSMDETATGYGLLAEDVSVAARSPVGHLPPAARGAFSQR